MFKRYFLKRKLKKQRLKEREELMRQIDDSILWNAKNPDDKKDLIDLIKRYLDLYET